MLAVVALSYEEEAEITQEVIQYVFFFLPFNPFFYFFLFEMLLITILFVGAEKRFSRS